MPKCLFERATALYLSGASHDNIPHDPVTHVQLDLLVYPDRRTERWDGALGVRPATAAEIAAFDDAERDTLADSRLNEKLQLAILIWLVKRLNELRTQPTTVFSALTKEIVITGIKAERDALNG